MLRHFVIQLAHQYCSTGGVDNSIVNIFDVSKVRRIGRVAKIIGNIVNFEVFAKLVKHSSRSRPFAMLYGG